MRLVPEVEFSCPEPGCGGKMRRKDTRFGLAYLCDRWFETRCPGALGCHTDGTPLGIPADQATRRERQKAHTIFDRLWKDGWMSRGAAYRWLSAQMGEDDPHIAKMDAASCQRVIACAHVELTRLEGEQTHGRQQTR